MAVAAPGNADAATGAGLGVSIAGHQGGRPAAPGGADPSAVTIALVGPRFKAATLQTASGDVPLQVDDFGPTGAFDGKSLTVPVQSDGKPIGSPR